MLDYLQQGIALAIAIDSTIVVRFESRFKDFAIDGHSLVVLLPNNRQSCKLKISLSIKLLPLLKCQCFILISFQLNRFESFLAIKLLLQNVSSLKCLISSKLVCFSESFLILKFEPWCFVNREYSVRWWCERPPPKGRFKTGGWLLHARSFASSKASLICLTRISNDAFSFGTMSAEKLLLSLLFLSEQNN